MNNKTPAAAQPEAKAAPAVAALSDEQKSQIIADAQINADLWAEGLDRNITMAEARAHQFDLILAAAGNSQGQAAQPGQQPVAAQEVLKYREQGRAEALGIILSLDAETGLDDYINSAQCPASGEYDSHWDEAKLRELLSVGDATYAAFDKAEAAYWEYQGHKDEADRAKAFAVNMHSSGRIREVLAKAGEYGLMGQLCTPAAPVPAAAPEPLQGWKWVPVEPDHAILKAMAESRAVDDEAVFPLMLDLLDFSGENKTHAVLRAAYVAALAAAPVGDGNA